VLSATNPNIYTVSRLNSEVRLLLENEMGVVWLVGEISNFSAPVSGHWYFTLKDSRAQVKCAMFRGNNRRVTFQPENGKQVLVKARLSLYEPRGDYQLIADSMQPEGDGQLQQQFDALKMKLAGEGLFAQQNKLPIPEHPKTVGVITSKTGAALHDILDVLKRRDPSLGVVIYPTMVQGDAASISIAQAIGRANDRSECDVLIVGRGGGSLEDLWCFNNEIVARTVAASQIPIISAVGHEVDVTICDFVADLRAPTPSAAAELVSQDQSHKASQVMTAISALKRAMSAQVGLHQQRFVQLQHKLDKAHPQYRLERQAQRLDDYQSRIEQSMRHYFSAKTKHLTQSDHQLHMASPKRRVDIQKQHVSHLSDKLNGLAKALLVQRQHQLAMQMEKLDTVSPLSTLKRGYSITSKTDDSATGESVLIDSSEVSTGDTLRTRLAKGEIISKVVETKNG
jgi:exodeoxyribonuclease VII large subunit